MPRALTRRRRAALRPRRRRIRPPRPRARHPPRPPPVRPARPPARSRSGRHRSYRPHRDRAAGARQRDRAAGAHRAAARRSAEEGQLRRRHLASPRVARRSAEGQVQMRRRHLAPPRVAQRFRLGADRQRATRPATMRIMRYRYLRQQSAEGHSSGPRGAALHSGYELGGRMRVDEVACAPIRSVWVLAIASTPTGYSTSTGAATSTSDPHKPPESVRAAPGIGLLGHAAGPGG